MAKRVLVLWANDSSSNLGVRVLSDGAEALIRRAWGVDTLVDFQSFEPGPLGTQLSGKVVLKGLLTGNRTLRSRIAQYDAVVDTGAGDSFTDIYGPKRLLIMFYARFVAKQAQVPVFFAPQTLGPFNTRWGQALARYSLRHASSVMARDSVSFAFSEKIGVPADLLATDVAFALPQSSASGAPAADVVLNVSGLLWNSDSHLPRERYQKFTRELIRALILEGRSVTLMPHVLDNPSVDNDVHTALALAEEFGEAVSVFIPEDLPEVRQFIANCKVVIGARMHACLNALSLGIPAIPLAYSRKFAPLLGDVGWPITLDLRSDDGLVEKVLGLLRDDCLPEQARAVREQAEERLNAVVGHLSESGRLK